MCVGFEFDKTSHERKKLLTARNVNISIIHTRIRSSHVGERMYSTSILASTRHPCNYIINDFSFLYYLLDHFSLYHKQSDMIIERGNHSGKSEKPRSNINPELEWS